MTNCKEYQMRIEEWLDGELNDTELADLKGHAEQCANCREELRRATETHDIINGAFSPATSACQAADLTVAKLAAHPGRTERKTSSVFRRTAQSRITRLAAAAVIIVGVMIGLKSFDGTVAWADVVKAFNKATDIHVIVKEKELPDKDYVDRYEGWLKNRVMLRYEDVMFGPVTIDDGVKRLDLDGSNKVAYLSDSYSSVENYMRDRPFAFLRPFLGDKIRHSHRASEVPSESNDTMLVYRVTSDDWEGKAWVDRASRLPLRTVYSRNADGLSVDATYDYEPISLGIFSTDIPKGYEVVTRTVSGRVVDEKGKGVAGAVVCASTEDIPNGRTDENGDFSIRVGRHGSLNGAIVLHAFRKDDPHRVAWRFIGKTNNWPFEEDVGGIKCMHSSGGMAFVVRDEKALYEFVRSVPGRAGELVSNHFGSEIKGIVLEMRAASVISGRVTNEAGEPIAKAVVFLDSMEVGVGRNNIRFGDLGNAVENEDVEMMSSLNLEKRAFTRTDENGRYELGSIPNVWYGCRLTAMADGYATEEKGFSQGKGCDFRLAEADITIRGKVIDNYGEPLVGRQVSVECESDLDGDGDRDDGRRDFDIEDALIDTQGRFEFTCVPRVSDLYLRVRSDVETQSWRRQNAGRQFKYYLDRDAAVEFEPGKKEYFVKIVPQRPGITIEVAVKDSAGKPLRSIPMGLSAWDITSQWSLRKLIGKTDEKGICKITEVPRVEGLHLWVCRPELAGGYTAWRKEVSDEYTKAVAESQDRYAPTKVLVKLRPGKKNYKVGVTLQPN